MTSHGTCTLKSGLLVIDEHTFSNRSSVNTDTYMLHRSRNATEQPEHTYIRSTRYFTIDKGGNKGDESRAVVQHSCHTVSSTGWLSIPLAWKQNMK